MSRLTNILLKSSIAASIIAGGTFVFRLFKASKDIELFSNIILHKLDLQNAYFNIQTDINNPTRSNFSIRTPFVKIGYNGQIIGSSTPSDELIEVKAFSQTKLDTIQIKFPLSESLTIATDLLSSKQNGKPVLLDIETSTYVKWGILNFPLKHNESINL